MADAQSRNNFAVAIDSGSRCPKLKRTVFFDLLMPSTNPLPLLTNPTRFITGALALLLVCGAALLGGGASGSAKIAHDQSRGSAGAEVPLLNTAAYPKDFKRNADLRWRPLFAGDDLYDLDSLAAHTSHAGFFLFARAPQPPSLLKNHCDLQRHTHSPQAARAPPLV